MSYPPPVRIRPLLLTGILLAACTTATVADTTTTITPTSTAAVRPTTSSTTTSTTAPPAESADFIIHNGKVITMSPERDVVTAVAVTNGHITAVGDDATVLERAGPDTRVVDVEGRAVAPGFVDPHTHLLQAPAPDLEGMRAGQQELLRGGTTTAGMPSVEPDELDAFRALNASDEIAVRTRLYVLYNSVCGDHPFDDFYLENSFTQDSELKLAVAGVKVFGDGGVCRAAAVSFEYSDDVPQELQDAGWVGNGDLYVTSEEVQTVVEEVDSRGGQVVIHAIGDETLRTVLRGMADARQSGLDLRHRIEHNSLVGLLTPNELALYGQAEVTPIVQMMPWAYACEEGRTELWGSVWPEQVFSSVENRTLISEANPGITMAWHGDGPYIPGTPLQQMFSVVTGGSVDADTGEPCYPDVWDWFPTVGVEEALALTTIDAASAMLINDRVGSLEAGKVADLLVLAEDPFQPDPEIGLAANYPLVTMIDGVVHHCEGDLCERFDATVTRPPAATGDWTPVDHAVVASVRASRERTPAAGAVDGDQDSAWVSGDSSPQWIELDLGEEKPVDHIRLRVDQDPSGLTIHEIYAGAEPDPQELVTSLEGNTEWGDELTAGIGASVRYIRIHTPDSPSWVAWFEITVVLDE